MPGSPDIVLPDDKMVVFVNGCFWHAHQNCKHFRLPDSRREFWKEKLWKNNENLVRDMKNRMLLEKGGWKVITVWECRLKKDFEGVVRDIIAQM